MISNIKDCCSRTEFYELLERDPCKAHREIISAGGLKALMTWVKKMAVEHSVTLALFPKWKNDIARWKIVAKILNGKVIDNSEAGRLGIHNSHEVKGLYEVVSHFRNAHIMRSPHSNRKILRSGTIVRADKLDINSRMALNVLRNKYNNDMKKRAKDNNMEFISIIKWLHQHPDLLQQWNKSKLNRRQSK